MAHSTRGLWKTEQWGWAKSQDFSQENEQQVITSVKYATEKAILSCLKIYYHVSQADGYDDVQSVLQSTNSEVKNMGCIVKQMSINNPLSLNVM